MQLTSVTRRLHHLATHIDTSATLMLRRKRARRVFESSQAPVRLHVGCGTVHLDGWVNTDFYESETADFGWDASYPYPLPVASCQFIYNEHFLEHIPLEIARRFLVDCHRMLIPGGVLRIAMPSLEATIEKYFSADWRDQEWLARPENHHVQTRCEMVNTAMRGWGHQWLYDQEELQRYLRAAGFVTMRECLRGESPVPELRDLETRPDSLLICEAVR